MRGGACALGDMHSAGPLCLRLSQAHSAYSWGRPKSSELTVCLGSKAQSKEGNREVKGGGVMV